MSTTVQQLQIDATQAIRALRTTTLTIRNYNDTVKISTQLVKAFNSASATAISSLHSFDQTLAQTTPKLDRLNQALDKETKAVNTATAAIASMSAQIRRLTQDMDAKNNKLAAQTQATKKESEAVQGLTTNLGLMSKLVLAQVVHSSLSVLTRAMIESAKEANEFQTRIAEIQTVSLEMRDGIVQSTLATHQWANQLLSLSTNFGIPVLEQAEALYEALSNQVITAGNSTQFMNSEMKLAITAVSTLNHAVNVTSTVINAYGKSALDAEQINATLFRGVEVGRFRLDELGSSFGRVALLSKQLGVSFEEQVGALALLTRLGVDADVANTLLANVFNGLIKPSKELTQFFNEQGFASSQAAINTLGFTGVMQLLASEIDKGNSKLAQLAQFFDDIRGLTGAAGLTGNLKDLQQAIQQVSNGTEQYNKAAEISLENFGRRGKIQLEKFKQFFLIEFGIPIHNTMVGLAESFGGADKALDGLYSVLIGGLGVLFSWKQVIPTLTVQTQALSNSVVGMSQVQHAANLINQQADVLIQKAIINEQRAAAAGRVSIIAIQQREQATRLTTQAVNMLAVAEARATLVTLGFNLAITAGIAAFAFLATESARAEAKLQAFLRQLRADLAKDSALALERLGLSLKKVGDAFEANSRRIHREWGLTLAEIRKINNFLAGDFEATFKAIAKSSKGAFAEAEKDLDKSIKKMSDEIDKARKKIESAEEAIRRLEAEKKDKEFEASISGKSPKAAVDAIIKEKARIEKELHAAIAAGDEKVEADLFKRLDELNKEAIKRLEKLKKEADELVETSRTKISSRGISVKTPLGSGGSLELGVKAPSGKGSTPRVRLPDGTEISGPRLPTATRKDTLTIVNKAKRDAEEAARLQEKINELTKTEAELRERILKSKKDVVADEKVKKADLETKLKKETAAAEKFKELMEELKAIGKDGKSSDVAKLIPDLFKAGTEGGIDPTKLAKALEEAKKLQDALFKKEVTDKTTAVLDAKEKELAAIRELEKKASEASIQAAKERAEKITKIIEEGLPTVENILKGIPKSVVKSTDTEINGRPIKDELRLALQANERLRDAAQAHKDLLEQLKREEEQGKVNNETLRKLEASQKALTIAAREYNALSGNRNRDANGNIKLGEDTLQGKIKDLEATINRVKDASKELQNANAEAATAAIEQQALEEELQKTKLELLNRIGAASALSGNAQIKAWQEVNKVLDATLLRLRNIEQSMRKAGTAPGLGGPGQPGAAFGRVGMDMHFTSVADGESIMNRLATRTYAPLLRMLNSAPPPLRSGDSTVLNFGDVTINTPQGTSTAQAADIMRQLKRLHRQGIS